MIVRAMRVPYSLRRMLAELNVLASFRRRKVISTFSSNCVTYQVTDYTFCGVENKRNPTGKWMDRTKRCRSGSEAVAMFPADRNGRDRATLGMALGGRDARAPRWGLLPSLLLFKGARRVSRPQLVTMRKSRPAWWPFVVLHVPLWISLFVLFPASGGDSEIEEQPHSGADSAGFQRQGDRHPHVGERNDP